jgi:hypothetical protein
LKRPQAIKFLQEDHFQQPKFRERFLREAKMAALLDHQHIVPIHDFGMEEQPARAYLVMPYEKGSLHAILKEASKQQRLLDMEQLVSYLEQISSALDYAHQLGVVHLDLKPQNLLVHNDGRLLLADFGLAHLIEEERLEGGTSLKYGTPHYMAPEQIDGHPKKQSDVYALGVILYQMLVGRRPFEGKGLEVIAKKLFREAPPPLQQWRPELPMELEEVLQRALAQEVAQRYQSAGELLVAFKDALAHGRERVREEERLRKEAAERLRRAEEERLRKLRLLETVITNEGDKPDAMTLVRQPFTEADVFALGQPVGDTSIPGTGTENDLLHFTGDGRFGVKSMMMPVFTQPNILREALLRNPNWPSQMVRQVNGKALLEKLSHDVTIVINPWSSLEFRLPVAQKRVRKAEKRQRRRTAAIGRATDRDTFISDELSFTPFAVRGQAFFLLAGLGSIIELLTHSTQSLHWTVGTVALATPLASILAVGTIALATPLIYLLGYRKAMNFLTMAILALVSAAAVFALTAYCSKLDFDHQRTSQLWFNLTRIMWLGKQVNFGLIFGGIGGVICGTGLLTTNSEPISSRSGFGYTIFWAIVSLLLSLLGWFILAILPLIFQWGFGFGYGWDISLISVVVGCIATGGLIFSFSVWGKASKVTIR